MQKELALGGDFALEFLQATDVHHIVGRLGNNLYARNDICDQAHRVYVFKSINLHNINGIVDVGNFLLQTGPYRVLKDFVQQHFVLHDALHGFYEQITDLWIDKTV